MVSLCLCVFASLCLFSRCMEGGLDLTQPKLDRCSRFYSIRRASVPLKRRNARHLCITAPSTIVFHNHSALDLKHQRLNLGEKAKYSECKTFCARYEAKLDWSKLSWLFHFTLSADRMRAGHDIREFLVFMRRHYPKVFGIYLLVFRVIWGIIKSATCGGLL